MFKFDNITDPQKIEMLLHEIIKWIDVNVLVVSSVIQAIIIVTAFLIAWAGTSRLYWLLDRDWSFDWYTRFGAPIARAIAPLSLPAIWIVLQWFSVLAAENAKWPNHLIKVVVSLLTAWIVIRLAATLIQNKHWLRVITVSVWIIAALSITNLLEPTQIVLADMGIQVGDSYISVLSVIKASIALGVLLYFAQFSANILDRRLASTANLSPSASVLLSKLFRILIFTVAIVIGLESVGIDLTAFAVFSGAVGLGLGFGLQKVIANLISGIILLMDKSVKPGDVISLGTTYGEIKTLGARYVSVITRDGTEHLIPNEELISQRVENWSFSNRMIRLRMPIGISYDADVHQAIALALEVAAVIPRILDEPKPVCQLTAFGESSLDLELRVWVNDPQNGLGVVRSQVLLGIWDKFKSNGIGFPYPQRDIHIKLGSPNSLTKAIDASSPSNPE